MPATPLESSSRARESQALLYLRPGPSQLNFNCGLYTQHIAKKHSIFKDKSCDVIRRRGSMASLLMRFTD